MNRNELRYTLMDGQPVEEGEARMDCEEISVSSSPIHRSQSGRRAMKE